MARIRQKRIEFARDNDFDFYFNSDVEKWISSKVITVLITLDLPVVAPYLQAAPGDPLFGYSNFHEQIGSIGEFVQSEKNLQICARELIALILIDLVHCIYIVRSDVLKRINPQLHHDNYEYRNFP